MGIGARNKSTMATTNVVGQNINGTGGQFFFAPGEIVEKIYFDLDDTLMPCQDRYDVSNKACLDLITSELGIVGDEERQNLHLHMKSIDAAAMMALKGKPFNIRRYENSWKQCYQEYAEKFGKPVLSETLEKIKDITEKTWNPPFDLYDGVVDTLKEFSERYPNVSLNILTMGNEEVQRIKVNALPEDAKKLFTDIVVVPDKNHEVMTNLFGKSPEKVMMVGNSEKSDINPALAVGAKALLIPNNTWTFMKEDVDTTNASFKTVKKFGDIFSLSEN